MAKRRAAPSPGPPEPDPRQLHIGSAADAVSARKPAAKALPAVQVAALAKRAVERRGLVAGRVVVRVMLAQATAEALSARAIREGRNLEDVAAEIVEREVKA